MTNKEYFRKVNRCGYRKENKEGLGFSYNVVIPQALALAIGIDKDSIIKFSLAGKSNRILKLTKT
jgi:hypothetical protein